MLILRQLEYFYLINTQLYNLQKIWMSEKIAIFIDILGYNTLNKKVLEYFQHHESTFSFCFWEILITILILYMKYIYQFKLLDLTSNVILQNQNITYTLTIVWILGWNP